MRSNLTTLLFALVAITIGVMVLLGVHLSRGEEKMVRVRFQELAQGRLRDLDTSALAVMNEVERSLLELSSTPDRSPETLRSWVRTNPLVRQVFRVDAQSRLLHPAGPDLSEDEREFVQRTESIWKQQAVLHAPAPAEVAGLSKSRSRVPSLSRGAPSGDSLGSLAARSAHGFVSWYWEEGLHLLFWRRDEGGGVIGVEVERIVLLSRLVGKLPAGLDEEGRVTLVDARGEVAYQWGAYEADESAAAFAEQRLSPPLDSFRLRYIPSPAQLAGLAGSGLPWAMGLSALALSLLVLFTYAIREQRRELAEAEKRVGFVTQVSHELKTPLTNIRLYTELLEDALGENEKAERHRQVILEESERLGRLIGNVLTFSRRGPDAHPLRARTLMPDEQVKRVAEQFRPALSGRGFELELDLQAPAPLRADPDALEQVLGNLLSNVEKYGAAGRWVGIRSRQEGGVTRITVEDRGPGVPAALRERIFEPFFRASDKLEDGATGTGIGLTISRELARRMGGELLCRDARSGGAVFELALPSEDATHQGERA